MNECGYDYVTFGKHDFSYGMEYLNEYATKLNATAVCQNLLNQNGDYLLQYQIKTLENGMKVGIVTDYVNEWEKLSNIENIKIVDPFEQAKNGLAELKDQVDVTICMYHGGFECDLATNKLLSETSENIAYKICEEFEFDLLLTGHQHMSIEGQLICGTYVFQPKENA